MPSFDVVCTVDPQEVDNAVNQTLREIGQRFDFKGSHTEVNRDDTGLTLLADDEYKLKALTQILHEKLARRQVPLRALVPGAIEPATGGTVRQRIDLQQGIPTEKAREIVKLVKSTKRKVQVAIQGDQVRATGKKRDDLQAIMALLREHDLGIAMQFTNFRE